MTLNLKPVLCDSGTVTLTKVSVVIFVCSFVLGFFFPGKRKEVRKGWGKKEGRADFKCLAHRRRLKYLFSFSYVSVLSVHFSFTLISTENSTGPTRSF